MELQDIQKAVDKKRKKRLFIGSAIAIMILILISALGAFSSTNTVKLSELIFAEVQKGDFKIKLVANGQFESRQPKLITSPVEGIIQKIYIEPGEAIQPGERLFKLYNDDLEIKYEKLKSQLNYAKLELELKQVRLELDQVKQETELASAIGERNILKAKFAAQNKLAKTGVISKLDILETEVRLENAEKKAQLASSTVESLTRLIEKELKLARSKIAEAQNELNSAANDIEKLIVKAPEVGQIQSIDVQLGEKVKLGRALLKFTKQDDLRFVAQVPEREAQKTNVNNSAKIRVNNAWLTGKIERISPTVNNGYIDIFISLDKQDLALKEALSAKVEIITQVIPNTLFVERPPNTQPMSENEVWLFDELNGLLVNKKVQLGAVSSGQIEVISGLLPSQKILMSDPKETWRRTQPEVIK
ncbi:efflux RND transporter periplasmic adaptor subunit [Alteromonas sp. a30]|uniref:efflux RND transporter periplasmic adaptor subunit n=1 Tax=Alteromonas sp. a30 TaxID=2730917 RepID=UPI00227E520C|nr:HlyD family efflux transporter periplasmic adaptor subunit [Alteromonas sp. a30]MCY7297169.1 HlyD family efflux transporter periplasmic adaptor subunit [Alteromonas sp. a30]